jgi:glutamine synthetase adenylyltransferase
VRGVLEIAGNLAAPAAANAAPAMPRIVRDEARAISTALSEALKLMAHSHPETRAQLSAALNYRGESLVHAERELRRTAQRVVDATSMITRVQPGRRNEDVRRIAARQLRDLFAAHDVPFSAYADAGHDAISPAVEVLVAIAACNGESLPADAARRLIQLANVEP